MTADEVAVCGRNCGSWRRRRKDAGVGRAAGDRPQCAGARLHAAGIAGKGAPVRIGVARDRAFCFYYEDSLDLLRQLGAELVPFSPLTDERFPTAYRAVLRRRLPELYAAQLEENHACAGKSETLYTRDALYRRVRRLHVSDAVHRRPRHGGCAAGDCFDTGRLTGSAISPPRPEGQSPLPRRRAGTMHEFHHGTPPSRGAFWRKSLRKAVDLRTRHRYAVRGLPHFHFYAKPVMAQRFLALAERRRYDGANEAYGH